VSSIARPSEESLFSDEIKCLLGLQGRLFQEVVACREKVLVGCLWEGAWGLAVYIEMLGLCEDQGGWCSCSGTPITGLVGLCAAKNQDI
jgi:hypothetical protein